MSEWRCFARFCMHMANKYVGIYSAASAAVTSAASAAVTSAASAAVSSAAEAVTSAAEAAVTSAASAAVSSAASAAVSSAASAAVTSAALRLVSSRCYCPSKLFGIYRQIIHFGFTRGIMSTCTHAIFRVQGTTRWTVLPSTMQDVSEGKHRSFGICDDTFEEIVRTNKLTSFYFIDSIPIDALCRQEGS